MNLKQALERAIVKAGGLRPLQRELGWSLGALAEAQRGDRPIPPLRAGQIAKILDLNPIEATLQALADQAKGEDVEFWLELIETYRVERNTTGKNP